MINWVYFPLSDEPTPMALSIINVFERIADEINSASHEGPTSSSNSVLSKITDLLEQLGFLVEKGKKKEEKILVPVLFGINGKVEKYFEADAYLKTGKFVLEIEAGRAVTNYQFLKDLFQACMMQDVDYLGIAIRNEYRRSNDFQKVFTFFDTLYKSNRLSLPLKGVLIIGY